MNSDESENDDEETIDQAEREEEGVSRDEELQELEAEMDMPLEKLLARYGGGGGASRDEDDIDDDKAEEMDDSEGLTSESEMEFEEDLSNLESSNVKGGLGIESLLGDSLGTQDAASSKLSDAAALAESFQPKGNTLESTKVITLVFFLYVEMSTQATYFMWLVLYISESNFRVLCSLELCIKLMLKLADTSISSKILFL